MDKVPYEVLDHAIQARDEVIARNKENQHQHHVLRFRSKKNDRQTITIRAQYCREPLRFYVRLLHNNAILAVDPNHPRHKMKPPFIMNIEDAIMVGRMRLAKLKWTRS